MHVLYLIEIFKRFGGISLREFQHSPPLCHTPSRGHLVAQLVRALCARDERFRGNVGIRLDDRNRISGSDSENDALHARLVPPEWGNSLSGNPPRFVSPPRPFQSAAVSNSLVYEQQHFVDIRRQESGRIEDARFEKISKLIRVGFEERRRGKERDANIPCWGEGEEKLSSFEISIVKRNGEAILEALIEFQKLLEAHSSLLMASH